MAENELSVDFGFSHLFSVSNFPSHCSRPCFPPVKPRWTRQPPDVLAVRLNSELAIDCEASGYPQPKIKLERLLNDRVLESQETGQLRTRYTKYRAGRYRCTAENSLGRIEREFQVKHYGKAIEFDECFWSLAFSGFQI